MFPALLIMALVFFKERIAFLDVAYHLFYITAADELAIQNYRFGAAVTQVVPLASTRMGLSLQAVAMLYSASFVVFSFLCYWVSGSLLRQYKLALISLLGMILFSTYTFFWAHSELPQGLSFLMLSFAIISSVKDGKRLIWGIPLIALIMPVVVFFHPAIVAPFLFVIVYYYLLDRQVKGNVWAVVAAVVFFFVCWEVKKVYYATPYDTQSMDGMHNFLAYFPHYFSAPYTMVFLKHCMTTYQWIPILLVLTIVVLTAQRKWLKLIVSIGGTLAAMFIVTVLYADKTLEDFYAENLMLPMGIVMAVPLVVDVLPYLAERMKRKNIATWVVVLMMVTAVVRILIVSDVYVQRTNWELAFLEKHKGEKMIIEKRPELDEKLIMSWGTPYEFWFLSSLHGGETACIIVPQDLPAAVAGKESAHKFLGQWGHYDYIIMNDRYFHFTDFTTPYKVYYKNDPL